MDSKKTPAAAVVAEQIGQGGERHQISDAELLTTNQGIPISDDQNSLRVGARGPTLLEDFVLREKITHFDHERIPERIVHARGSGAHGYFEVEESLGQYTTAAFLQKKGTRTPVFVRFSTVVGGAGSVDLPRDVRGFAVKFYTTEGNFDLVGNNIPVFFIQDAMKFPDLVHSVKMEPDRGFPQSASAHDTFWDFMSLMPETTHMVMWAMSDRAIPRSFRTIEGFGVNTFRLVDAQGVSTFVKFHFRPRLGLQSVLWDEAVKISGADPDYHRRDLWDSIASGDFPEWDFAVQMFTEEQANRFDFDVLDATKVIPEELVPLKKVGRLVLDRNPDNFFAETEQIAFCPANVVPGIDFSNDPLLQGRLFSYLDTQLSRLGSPNFHEIPINAPKCPMRNFQRDGHMRTTLQTGRVAYEPNSLAPAAARENPERGFRSAPRPESGGALRVRSESFADHYSHARMFWLSQTETERNHIVSAYVFELGKVETPAIRERVISHLVHVDTELAARVSRGIGLASTPAAAPTKRPPRKDIAPSPALSILGKTEPSLKGRVVACLLTDGSDRALVTQLQKAVTAAGARLKIVAPRIGGVLLAGGELLPADFALPGGPSVLFDAVVLSPSAEGAALLAKESAALDFVRDAFAHLKIIGHSEGAAALLSAAGLGKAWASAWVMGTASDKATTGAPDGETPDAGLVAIGGEAGVGEFVKRAAKLRIWEREPKVRLIP